MKTNVKTIGYSILSLGILSAPLLVGAQFQTDPGGTNLPSNTIIEIIKSIMQWLLYAVGFIAVAGFALAGILYITAAGDEGRMGQAKNAMMYSIIGVIVAVAGLVALKFADNLMKANNRF